MAAAPKVPSEPVTTPDDTSKRTRPRVYGPHQRKKGARLLEKGSAGEVPVAMRPVFETVLGALTSNLKKGEEFMGAPHVERVIGELVASGKVNKGLVPIMKSFAVTAHDMVARPEFLEKSKDLVKSEGLDERHLEIDEGAVSPLKPEKAVVEKVMRGKYTGKKTPAPRYESSLPPKFADFVGAVLGGEVGKKFANQAIKRQAMAGSIPVTYGRREVRDIPLTRMMAQDRASGIIDQLSADDQQILKLAFRHNQNIYDIAEQMNLSPGEVSKRLNAAKKQVGKVYQQRIVGPKQAARAREKRAEKVESIARRGRTAGQKIESRNKGEDVVDYQRKGPMEKSPKIATVDRKVKPFKMPTTSTGKPLDYIDKKTGRPKYYTAAELEKMYHPDDEGPVLGMGAPDVSQTKVALWNKLAREGNVTAAIKLARWKNGQYGKRMAQVGEMKVQVKKDWRTGKWVPKTRLNEKTGKQEEVEKFETPRDKASKRNRNEGKALGVTGSEIANLSASGKLSPQRSEGEAVKGKNPIDVLRRRFAETKFRKGYHGPFEKKTEEQVKKLAAETTEEEMAGSLLPKIRRKLRSGIQGPLEKRDADRTDRLAMKLFAKKLAKLEAKSRTPGNRGTDASGNKTGTGIHGDIVAMSRKMEEAGGDEEANIRRIEGETAKRSKVADRLLRIRKALGKSQYDKPIGPELPSRGRVINEVNAAAEETPKLPKARRKPIYKRPGRGPGIKEALFSMLAKAGARR